MKKEELDEIIYKLENSNSPFDAYLAIYQYGGGPDESFAKANKEGLELFAAQLLKASRDFDNVLSDKEKNVIPLSYNEEWIDGDIFIQYIEPTNKKRELAKEQLYKQPFVDRLVLVGCFAVIILLLISTVIGLISILKLIF
jgi:hypothetical protein